MGQEAKCSVRHGGRRSEGKALLETEELVFRGDFRLAIPFKSMTACEAKDGALSVTFRGGKAVFALGAAAEKWAHRIKNPRSLLEKLGVKPGLRVSVVGVDDAPFRADLDGSGAEVSAGAKPAKDSDIIFYGAAGRADLARLAKLAASLTKAGAIWVVRPKGTKAITDIDVIEAAREAGLVDVKVAAFSKTHTAEKLVIPVSKR